LHHSIPFSAILQGKLKSNTPDQGWTLYGKPCPKTHPSSTSQLPENYSAHSTEQWTNKHMHDFIGDAEFPSQNPQLANLYQQPTPKWAITHKKKKETAKKPSIKALEHKPEKSAQSFPFSVRYSTR